MIEGFWITEQDYGSPIEVGDVLELFGQQWSVECYRTFNGNQTIYGLLLVTNP